MHTNWFWTVWQMIFWIWCWFDSNARNVWATIIYSFRQIHIQLKFQLQNVAKTDVYADYLHTIKLILVSLWIWKLDFTSNCSQLSTNHIYSFFSLCMFLSDIPADDILELFGKTFFEFCQDSGYDKILQVLGATPRDFLQVYYSCLCTNIRNLNMCSSQYFFISFNFDDKWTYIYEYILNGD